MNELKYTIREDCFACNTMGACTVLSEALCKTRGSCPFFKTKMQAVQERELSRRAAIAAGYYVGGDRYTPRAEGGRNA